MAGIAVSQTADRISILRWVDFLDEVYQNTFHNCNINVKKSGKKFPIYHAIIILFCRLTPNLENQGITSESLLLLSAFSVVVNDVIVTSTQFQLRRPKGTFHLIKI